MKIEIVNNNRRKVTMAANISLGDYFEWREELYLEIEDRPALGLIVAIKLSDGKTNTFNYDMPVYKCKKVSISFE